MHIKQQSLHFVDRRRTTLIFVSLFLILIGSRAAVINYSGSSTPFMDEWDGDAAYLLEPYVRGNLSLRDLFSTFDEHIIFLLDCLF